MSISPYAGKPAEPWMLTDIPLLITSYYSSQPDPSVPEQRVVFGTSGHRGSALETSFNELHILAACQAICDFRFWKGIDGPLFLGLTLMRFQSRPLPVHSKCLQQTGWR